MSQKTRCTRRAVAAVLLAACCAAPVNAQLYEYRGARSNSRSRAAGSAPATDTQVTIEIFTGREGVGFQAQQWQSTFAKSGVMVRIRPGMAGDKISIREKKYGKLREVFAVGRMERDGSLVFPDRRFRKSESAALEEWLRELKTYGAQGSPAGSPHWGLSQAQFDALYAALAGSVEKDVDGLMLDDAIRGLELPAAYPFRMTPSAEKALAASGRGRRPVRMALAGFARGTALAMLLSQYGLGFRPNRTPSGAIELACVAGDDPQVWPIGWNAPDDGTPAQIAPKLFEQTQVELKDQKLRDVLDAVSAKTETPVRLDAARIEDRGLDLNAIQVSVPNRRLAWSSLLSRIVSPSFLTAQIRCDERRRPFVWITVLPNAPPRKVRAAPNRRGAGAWPPVHFFPSRVSQNDAGRYHLDHC